MGLPDFFVFAFASLILNITPGNDMLYVVSRTTEQGVKAGIISALGIMCGCIVHVIAAVIGLSAIISRSAFAFEIIKYLGAAYLIYLGLHSFSSKKKFSILRPGNSSALSSKKLFWQGVLTNILNPKVALFFLAFLPQFITPGAGNEEWQILLLGFYFNISGTLVNILVAVLVGKLGNWLNKSPVFMRRQQKLTGLVLIALGIKIALSSKINS